ncbi:hypothetical protein FQN57_000010 [Myotisia sp. PD_48]|nr:hypothetical protein FQN57_000010 [Myotisia sp. PD_48]
MLDPIPPPPRWLQRWAEPMAESLSLPTLPYHIHEIILSFAFYQFTQSVVSPWLSAHLFPSFYLNFPKRTKLNWDIHVVSLVQSTLITVLALWVMFVDQERKSMTAGERVYGYSGACGLIQAMATGYFVWDLIISTRYINLFGVGMWFHAASALWVFSLGFRPFVNYYGPTFILYELSSPFLNFHWFFDKVNMTGSRAQWYNGMMLLSVFFSCRLVWGTYHSIYVFFDIYKAFWQSRSSALSGEPFNIHSLVFNARNTTLCSDETCIKATAEVSQFAQYSTGGIPVWLVFTYLGSNFILNSLNYYWFSKMIDTVMKRFRTTKVDSKTVKKEAELIVLEAAATLEEEESVFITGAMNGSMSTDESKLQPSTQSGQMNNKASVRRRKA